MCGCVFSLSTYACNLVATSNFLCHYATLKMLRKWHMCKYSAFGH